MHQVKAKTPQHDEALRHADELLERILGVISKGEEARKRESHQAAKRLEG